jgi:hypothetical protein
VNRALGIVAIAVFVAGCTSPVPSTMPVAPTLASPSDAAGGEWQRLDLPNGDEAFLASVAATADDVVIVGVRDFRPVAWTSRDGGAWTFEQLGPEGAFPGTALAFGDRVLAIGSRQENRCAHPDAIVFWVRAADGRWTLAPFNNLFCAGGSGVTAVSAGRAAIVGSGAGDQPIAWFSDDGLTWLPRAVRGGIFPKAIVPMGDGFAAIGTFGFAGWWFARSDGRTGWTIVPFFDPRAEEEAVGFADLGRGFIAWFVDPAGEIAAFTSDTGDAWQSVEMNGLSGIELQRVARMETGYVAFGRAAEGPRLFVSSDGVSWRGIRGPSDSGSSSYGSLVLWGDRAILLGTIHVGPDADVTAAWTGPASIFEP